VTHHTDLIKATCLLACLTGYILRWLSHSQMVTHPSTNPAAHDRESNSQPVDCKSDVLSTTSPSHLLSNYC